MYGMTMYITTGKQTPFHMNHYGYIARTQHNIIYVGIEVS